jgi:hypothetical protein
MSQLGLRVLKPFLGPLALGNVTADCGQSKTPPTPFIGDKENVLPHGYGCTRLEMSKERLSLPPAIPEDDWQNIVPESIQIVLRYVVENLGFTYLFVPC